MITTVKDLKNALSKLPDDMEVKGYKGGDGELYPVSAFIMSKETLTEEELQDGYPDGLTPVLVLDID